MNCFCRRCKEGFGILDMKKNSVTKSTGRGICKKCHSEYCASHIILKKAAARPDLYLSCDECDRIFTMNRRGANTIHEPKQLNTKCPFCKSEEISRFAG